MKKQVLFLPILVSLMVFAGFAAAETMERLNSENYIQNANFTNIENLAWNFAKAPDDGGALGEKAKCRAMLEHPQNDPSEISRNISQTTGQIAPAAKLVSMTSLTAIREEEA